jgi:hypothetical protein
LVEYDWPSIVSIAFGSSGIVAWLLTYWQVKEERKNRAREHFRQIVLTPDFMDYLGLLVSLLRTVGMIKNEDDLKEHIDELKNLRTEFLKKVVSGGTMFFLSSQLLMRIVKLSELLQHVTDRLLARDFSAVSSVDAVAVPEITGISSELKRLLGFDSLIV